MTAPTAIGTGDFMLKTVLLTIDYIGRRVNCFYYRL